MRRRGRGRVILAGLAFVALATVYGLGAAADRGGMDHRHMAQTKSGAPAPKAAPSAPKLSRKSPAAEYTPTVRFRLRTELAEGKMAFVGVGGAIEGIVNPPLRVAEGDVVQVTLINNDGVEHDVVFPEFNAGTDRVNRKGASSVTVFRADKSGEFAYFCSLPGHRQAGMEGKLAVGSGQGPVAALPPSVSIARNPADLPGPLAAGAPRTHQIELESVELVGRLANETTYNYWTFNGKVPGPFLRVRVGDTVELTFKNHEGQPDDPLGRLPRDDRPRGRRGDDPDPAGRDADPPLPGAQPGALRVPLRHAHGGEPHLERDVRAHPRRAAGRAAEGGSRVLRHAGRALHRPALRAARSRRVQRGEAARRSGRSTSSSTARWARSRRSTR